MPVECSIPEFNGNRTYVLHYHVKTWIRECPDTTLASGTLLANRYEQTEDIDKQHLATRVISGKVHFRTDFLLKQNMVPDDFRALCIPARPAGFYRESIRVVTSAAGNELSYQVVHRERMYDLGETDPRQTDADGFPGYGVLEVTQADYSVSSMVKDGTAVPISIAQVAVTVIGNKFSTNWRLTQYCYRLIKTKLPIDQIPNSGTIRQFQVVQALNDRRVSVQIAMELVPQGSSRFVLLQDAGLMQGSIFANKGGINPAPPFDSGMRGTAGTCALTAPVKDACAGDDGVPGSIPPSALRPGSPTPPPEVTAVSVAEVNILPDLPNRYSPSATMFTYTDYRIDVTHSKYYHRMVCPEAGPRNPDGTDPDVPIITCVPDRDADLHRHGRAALGRPRDARPGTGRQDPPGAAGVALHRGQSGHDRRRQDLRLPPECATRRRAEEAVRHGRSSSLRRQPGLRPAVPANIH